MKAVIDYIVNCTVEQFIEAIIIVALLVYWVRIIVSKD